MKYWCCSIVLAVLPMTKGCVKSYKTTLRAQMESRSESTIKLLDIGIKCFKTEMTSKHYNGQVELLISTMQCTYQYY